MKYNILTWQQASRQANDLKDFFSLAPTPSEEPCTQAGHEIESQLMECQAYIKQLIRYNGTPPEGAEFFIIENNTHDFGIYYEAGIWFIPTPPEAEYYSPSEEYANRCEIGPDRWDHAAKEELRRQGHPFYQPAKVVPIRKTA